MTVKVSDIKSAFEECKTAQKFSASYEDVERIFFVEDFFQSEGYISTRFSRALCRRMSGLFWNWNNYLHNIIVPNPNSMVMVAESQMFNEEERKDIIEVMNKLMAHVSLNTKISMLGDQAADGSYIDASVALYNDLLQPKMKDMVEKMQAEWAKKASEPAQIDRAPRQH